MQGTLGGMALVYMYTATDQGLRVCGGAKEVIIQHHQKALEIETVSNI